MTYLLGATLSLYRLDNDVYILGEFNADLGTEGGPQACTPVNEQGHILLRYLSRWEYLLYNLHLSPSQEDPINTSDHLPILAQMELYLLELADETLSSVTGNIKLRKAS